MCLLVGYNVCEVKDVFVPPKADHVLEWEWPGFDCHWALPAEALASPSLPTQPPVKKVCRQVLWTCKFKVIFKTLISVVFFTSPKVTSIRKRFSFKFNLQVVTETANHIQAGVPAPEELVHRTQSGQLDQSELMPTLKLPVETSPGDSRLWVEILRNLSKDLSKQPTIQLSETAMGRREKSESLLVQEGARSLKSDKTIAYSCGHTFSDTHFHLQVLVDFMRRLEDLPIPIPRTASFLQQYYKLDGHYSCACPVCVFQFLRKAQLQQCPEVPIKPWNPWLCDPPLFVCTDAFHF